jgi:hypothetical protein
VAVLERLTNPLGTNCRLSGHADKRVYQALSGSSAVNRTSLAAVARLCDLGPALFQMAEKDFALLLIDAALGETMA